MMQAWRRVVSILIVQADEFAKRGSANSVAVPWCLVPMDMNARTVDCVAPFRPVVAMRIVVRVSVTVWAFVGKRQPRLAAPTCSATHTTFAIRAGVAVRVELRNVSRVIAMVNVPPMQNAVCRMGAPLLPSRAYRGQVYV